MDELQLFKNSPNCRLYEIVGPENIQTRRLIASTSESRIIANDPFVLGVEYTDRLETACTKVLSTLDPKIDLGIEEAETAVLNILRGGLNFGLRQSLHRAYGWNSHSSAFISAQRARRGDKPDEWYISENTYQKVYLGKRVSVVFGDVVATGTSLEFALNRLLEIILASGASLNSVLFFTIGGIRSEEILIEIDRRCRSLWPDFGGSTVVYFEGCFAVADAETEMSVKLTGTDLIRTNSLLAPEFVESQYECPSYPLERCTIYDAGSRAFYVPEYLEDLVDYWTQTLTLARSGFDFPALLKERFPELDPQRFSNVDLEKLCLSQLEKAQGNADK